MRKNILVTPLMAVLAASAVYGQDATTASMTGRVTDQDNRAVQGVKVIIASPALLRPRQAVTDANGSFRVQLLIGGQYTVTYSLDGYISRKMTLTLVAGATANASTKLQKIGVQGATVEITTESTNNMVQVDKTDTVTQTSFTSVRMEEMGFRGLAAITQLTPGIEGNFNTNYNIRGSVARGNKLLQDGQMVNDALLGQVFDASGATNDDMIESIAVVQSPMNAKLGNTDGGLVSIVTKRGGNEFRGSLRCTGQRGNPSNMWTAAESAYYPNRLGVVGDLPTSTGGNDNLARTWEFTIMGPIVPNYLTFAYGGSIMPVNYISDLWWEKSDVETAWEWEPARYAQDRYRKLGTWYQNFNVPEGQAGYGDAIRRSELGELTGPNAKYYRHNQIVSNTFNFYLQIHPDHQLTYYYMERSDQKTNHGQERLGYTDPMHYKDSLGRAWNVSYKGVIGSAGLLEARYGSSRSYRENPLGGGTSIALRTYATLFPIDSNGAQNDVTNYHGSGIIDTAFNRWGTQSYNSAYFLTKGLDTEGSDGSINQSTNLNYQHVLELKGSHIIDIGFNRQYVDAPSAPQRARFFYNPVGQISTQLIDDDVISWFGNATLPAYTYAGKYIVYNMNTATVGSLEPQAVDRPNGLPGALANVRLLYDDPIWIKNANPALPGAINTKFGGMIGSNSLPFMRLFSSTVSENATGSVLSDTRSYYLNDMWTISDNHSVMIGVRADQFILSGDKGSLFQYTKMTPRFEYKYDVFGDQKHLFALSYGQFHQMAQLNLYIPFIDRMWDNTETWGWGVSPNNHGHYYLVEESDLTNPNNYNVLMSQTNYGSQHNVIEDGFKPPTSTEMSLRYRRSFNNGGYLSVTYVNRSWSDLYDFYPNKVLNPDTGEMIYDIYRYTSVSPQGATTTSNRLRTIMRNTKDFERTYNAVEMQWDFPLSSKVIFGGWYNYSRFMHNQSNLGSSSQRISGTDSVLLLQWPEHFDEMFGSREAWAPMLSQTSEFSMRYYFIINLTQGKARSNFTLNGTYWGSSYAYDRVRTRVGYPVVPPLNDFPAYGGGSTMNDSFDVIRNTYTTTDGFSNDLAYNLTMPLVRNLSWFLNVNVYGLFNHRYKAFAVPGGTSTTSYIPYPIQNSPQPGYVQPNADPWPNGYVKGSDVLNSYSGRGGTLRSISMSTGLRF
jgi:hypothetical protein